MKETVSINENVLFPSGFSRVTLLVDAYLQIGFRLHPTYDGTDSRCGTIHSRTLPGRINSSNAKCSERLRYEKAPFIIINLRFREGNSYESLTVQQCFDYSLYGADRLGAKAFIASRWTALATLSPTIGS